MNTAHGKKGVTIAGFAPRRTLEKPCDEDKAFRRLTSLLKGEIVAPGDNVQNSGIPLSGLSIAEREFVDALATYGTYDEYSLLIHDRVKQAIAQEDLRESGVDHRMNVRLPNELYSMACDEVIVHSAFSNAGIAIATRECFFAPTTPVHFFFYEIPDVTTLVPSMQTMLSCGRSYDCITPFSQANRIVAENIFAHLTHYYEKEWKIQPTFMGRFTKARLGINTMAFIRDMDTREFLRKSLLIDDQCTVFLYLGRLDANYKADLFPLVRVFHNNFIATKRNAMLLIAGYDEGGTSNLTAFIQTLRGGEQIKVLPNITAREKKFLYSMADVFVSPSDNIQEAFGLTIFEAMASGLPVIASDWSSYRESVENGVNGFLIKTWWSTEVNLIADSCGILNQKNRHLFYSQTVCIDIDGLRKSMLLLDENSDLRRRMGEQARHKAQLFDWSNSVRVLEEEWDLSLEIARSRCAQPKSKRETLLFGLDMSQVHSHYPTAYFSDHDRISHVNVFFGQSGHDFISQVMGPNALLEDEGQICQSIYLTLLGAPEPSIGEFVEKFACTSGIDSGRVKYCLFRLAKYGFLNVTKLDGNDNSLSQVINY